MLGIPTVQDRLIQQLLLQVLIPIFDPQFSEHSYGFRPGRSAQDAMRGAQQYAQVGKEWVVDLDITKFFDHVNHDILMGRIAQVIRDKRVLHLIGKYLRRGAMVEGVVTASEEGTPQGGPLSPLLANIYLDALDKELERRGHRFCRYADDCNIYVGSQAAAERTLGSIQSWIEKHLRLKVNAAKTGTGKVWERKFLGFRLDQKKRIGIAPESLERFKARVRELWCARQSRTSNQLRDAWRRYVRGWWGYFQLAEVRWPLRDLEPWIRRHIRKCFRLRWHNRRGRLRQLRQLGLCDRALGVASSSRGAWQLPKPLGSTAGCGKPHVRCGRVAGRNPGHSTRFWDPPYCGIWIVVIWGWRWSSPLLAAPAANNSYNERIRMWRVVSKEGRCHAP
jgi:RNA-directed DNA polymerase